MLFCTLGIQVLATLTLLVSWRMAVGIAHFSQNHPQFISGLIPTPQIYRSVYFFCLFYCNSGFATGHNSQDFHEEYNSDHQGRHGPRFSLGA